MDGRFVSYLRVSTLGQGQSGLGLDAQRGAVTRFLNGGNHAVLREFVEVESGKNNARPELLRALEHCKLVGATLIVAKLDRLARNARFLLDIVERSGDDGVVFCDLPNIPKGPAGKFMVGMMAQVAELEAGMISARTKDALAVARDRGVKLGGFRAGAKVDNTLGTQALQDRADAFAKRVAPMVREMHGQGMSLRQIAASLTQDGVRTARGGMWTAAAVRNVLARVAA